MRRSNYYEDAPAHPKIKDGVKYDLIRVADDSIIGQIVKIDKDYILITDAFSKRMTALELIKWAAKGQFSWQVLN